MHEGRAILLHPILMRPPWHVALVVAAADVATHLAITLAVIAGGTFVVAAALVLAVVAAPLLVVLLAWLLWRASRDGARGVKRSLARARRRARALGLRVVQGAAGS
jgi:membrane protein implicated in regulation of membrane protease activity